MARSLVHFGRSLVSAGCGAIGRRLVGFGHHGHGGLARLGGSRRTLGGVVGDTANDDNNNDDDDDDLAAMDLARRTLWGFVYCRGLVCLGVARNLDWLGCLV